MFSTMMTDESTMMPKSTAPIDSKLADLPRKKSIRKGKQQGQRHVNGHDDRGSHVAEKHQQDRRHQNHSDQQILLHGFGGDADQGRAVVEYIDLHAGQHAAGLSVQLFDQGLDVSQGGERFLALAQQHDGLDGVVVVFPAAVAVGVSTSLPWASFCGWLSSTCPSRV